MEFSKEFPAKSEWFNDSSHFEKAKKSPSTACSGMIIH